MQFWMPPLCKTTLHAFFTSPHINLHRQRSKRGRADSNGIDTEGTTKRTRK